MDAFCHYSSISLSPTMVQISFNIVFVLFIAINRGEGCGEDEDVAEEQCTTNTEGCQLISSGNKKYSVEANKLQDDVVVYTVATEETEGFQRYMLSANEYGIKPEVLGMGEKWKGGSGWKINLLKAALEPYKNDKKKIILFTDGYDVVFMKDLIDIVEKFKSFNASVLFGAEGICHPKPELAALYPPVTKGKKYLNSGLFMGYAANIYKLLTYKPIKDEDDDQLYFTEAYLNETLRKELNFTLDHKSELFQNLNGATNEVELICEDDKEHSYKILRNIAYFTNPLIVQGNGPSKVYLNNYGNYLARAYHPVEGCRHCKYRELDMTKFEEMPIVLLGLFVEYPTPFLEEQLEKVYKIDYPKNRMHLFIHNSVKYHNDHVNNFVTKYGSEYLSLKQIKPEDEKSEWTAREMSLDECLSKKCDFYFVVDSVAHLDNPKSLQLLIQQNRTVVAPLLVRVVGPNRLGSNFWGMLSVEGYYAKSHDYMEIIDNTRRGLWNVPYISNCYLVNATIFKRYDRSQIKYVRDNLHADMAFCANLRDLNIFLYVSNREDFGHLVNADSYDISVAEADMYQIFDNERDWEARYIHPEYHDNLLPYRKHMQPCRDVYWFPVVTERFCDALVHMMENYGKWSLGQNYDPRLDTGYEAVPTRDIHMKQVGFEKHWLHFLKLYVRPLVEYVYTGYNHGAPFAVANFVVRYRPEEQASLRPHYDTSTYTINIALNNAGIDYEGGGCRFIRYNCSVVDTRKGWMLMHPGKLTHYHEGLLVTKGTRYIMVAFVDP